MAKWTRLLRMRAIVNGRLVMTETQQACYYQYIIFPTDKQDFSIQNEPKIIRSGFNYTSGIGAFSAGKAAAKKMISL